MERQIKKAEINSNESSKRATSGRMEEDKIANGIKGIKDRFSKKKYSKFNSDEINYNSLVFHFINFLHCLKYHFKKQ